MAKITTVTIPPPRPVSVPTQVQTRVENGLVITESFPGHKGVKGQRGGSAPRSGGGGGVKRATLPKNWNARLNFNDPLDLKWRKGGKAGEHKKPSWAMKGEKKGGGIPRGGGVPLSVDYPDAATQARLKVTRRKSGGANWEVTSRKSGKKGNYKFTAILPIRKGF